jgi:hypothetical protein
MTSPEGQSHTRNTDRRWSDAEASGVDLHYARRSDQLATRLEPSVLGRRARPVRKRSPLRGRRPAPRPQDVQGLRPGLAGRTGEYSDRINSMPKYVASRTLEEATWNATIIKGNVTEAAKLKHEPGENILKLGTGELSSTPGAQACGRVSLLGVPNPCRERRPSLRRGRHDNPGTHRHDDVQQRDRSCQVRAHRVDLKRL